MTNSLVDIHVMKLFAVCFILLMWQTCSAGPAHPRKSHHSAQGFRNIHTYEDPGFLGFLRWRWDRLWMDLPDPESYRFPLVDTDPGWLKANRDATTLTWIGHATVLLQMKGRNILTDPQFSDRASPVSWAGPKRVVPPALRVDQLPPIELVLLSHDHYDSLDTTSIVSLSKRPGGDRTTFFVPLGLKTWFENLGAKRVVELDWWESHMQEGLTITAVPVHHWSKRGLVPRNSTLWAGWVIDTGTFKFFFAGDSGYQPLFKEIGRKLGPFDLSLIPIGAYEPRWFMRHHHMSPDEAVQVHLDVRSKKSVAIHWGTFPLTDEPLDEPPKALAKARKASKLAEEAFLVLKHGETIVLDETGTTESTDRVPHLP
jgi:N-acyl-phosphatidylethanolamine-hydrolysing phospholipase D